MTGFDTYFDEQMTDPDFARAYREARLELGANEREAARGESVSPTLFFEDARVGRENVEP